MKKFNYSFLPILFAAAFLVGPLTTAPAQNTNGGADFPPGDGLRMNFRGVPLETVLDYMSEAAGFIINLKPGVNVEGKVDVWSDQPLNKEEAITLLKQILNDHGYTTIPGGRTLTIIKVEDSPKSPSLPVKIGGNPADIPDNADVITQIIPARPLNPVELVKILTPLLPPGVILSTDQSADALIMTDTQSDIRRVAEIVAALDSVSSSANTLRVFPLKYADAKALAGLIKELFSTPDSSVSNGTRPGGNFIRFPGGPGFSTGLPGGSSGTDTSIGQTPVSHVTAVADEHSNSVIVSAPDGLISAIEQLVKSVDVSVQDITDVEVFLLKNADPSEMADLLSNLFPSEESSTDASRSPIQVQFTGQGGRGGQPGGARQGTDGQSDRMQKLGKVLAVPDRRTQSLVVSAAKNLMPQIASIINRLDAIEAGRTKVVVIRLKYAEVQDVQRVLQELIPSANSSGSSATAVNDPLDNRQRTILNNQMSSGRASGSSAGLGSGRGGSGFQ